MQRFQEDLKKLNSLQIVRKYIFNGGCHAIDDAQYYELKHKICEHFEIEFNDIVLVGSGKLGFSIKPSRRYGDFNDESDIDIALVSPLLFRKVWEEAYLYKKSGAYWPKSKEFFEFLSQGWIRPDKLPLAVTFKFTNYWWDFFNRISASQEFGPYKIRAGLYNSWFFLQEYQKICIEECINESKK
jgi:hypothetical protein